MKNITYTHVLDSLVRPHCKKKELWARPPVLTPVPAQPNNSSPPVAVVSRRVKIVRKMHTCFDSLVRVSNCLRTLPTCQTPWSVFRNSNDGRIKNFFVRHCLGAWDWWSGRGDTSVAQHTRQPTRETTERETLKCDAGGIFWELLTRSSAAYQTQCDEPLQVGHRRCGCWSWRQVDQLKFGGIGMQWSAVFVIVRLFCRGPYRRTLLSQLWRDVLGEEFIAGMECRGLRHGITEIVVAVGMQPTPLSRPSLVLVAEVRDCTCRSFRRRLAPPCLVHVQTFERAVEDGAGKIGARMRLDAALEAAEDGHVAGLPSRTCCTTG